MSYQNDCIHFIEKPLDLSPIGKVGVSLHCHTRFSKEMLDFLPYYAAAIPVVRNVWERECRRYELREGKAPNFNTGYWEPPLTGNQVFESERGRLAASGLDALVSITDHDSIGANLEIREEVANSIAPVSMEWTVPFGRAYFHLGIHNLPVDRSDELSRQLLNYTFAEGQPDNARLHEIFEMLNALPEVLIVFNHPVWDIEMIGQEEHNVLLKSFVAEHIRWIHALEINGFRPWNENRQTIALAEQCGLPLISGGDRHCLHTNTMVNITDAGSFAEFVDEIRIDRRSSIAVMPEYREPLALRQVSSMAQIMGYYPEFPVGRQRWFDRVYFDAEDGTGLRSLASHWEGKGPAWHRLAIGLISVLSHRTFRPLYHLTVEEHDIVPKRLPSFAGLSAIGRRPMPAER
jgi:hypothetical protein